MRAAHPWGVGLVGGARAEQETQRTHPLTREGCMTSSAPAAPAQISGKKSACTDGARCPGLSLREGQTSSSVRGWREEPIPREDRLALRGAGGRGPSLGRADRLCRGLAGGACPRRALQRGGGSWREGPIPSSPRLCGTESSDQHKISSEAAPQNPPLQFPESQEGQAPPS